MALEDLVDDVHLTSLEGLGSAYRMKGYFILKLDKQPPLKINFDGVAFGGNYGGHNVSLNVSEEDKQMILRLVTGSNGTEVEDLITEVQRRLLNNEMVVDYDALRPESQEASGLGEP